MGHNRQSAPSVIHVIVIITLDAIAVSLHFLLGGVSQLAVELVRPLSGLVVVLWLVVSTDYPMGALRVLVKVPDGVAEQVAPLRGLLDDHLAAVRNQV